MYVSVFILIIKCLNFIRLILKVNYLSSMHQISTQIKKSIFKLFYACSYLLVMNLISRCICWDSCITRRGINSNLLRCLL